jgi:hypothetical protein
MNSMLARTTRIWTTATLLALGSALAQGAPPAVDDDGGGLDALVAAHPVFGPALAYRSAASEIAERSLRDAENDAARAGTGLTASLSWRPTIDWRGTGDETFDLEAGSWSSNLTASVGWRADAQAWVRARLDLHRAAIAHVERVNHDLRDAVSRHIDLQRAHVALTIAQDTAATRAATLEAAERADLDALTAAPDATEPRTLLASRLDAERAVAAVERAARDLAAAERRAAETGFDPRLAAERHRERLTPLPLEGWRLWLPDADPLASPAVARAALELAAAEASAQRVRVSGLLDDLLLEVGRVEEDARLLASVGLDEGRPTAALDLSLRSASRTSWTVELSAVLRLDDGFLRDLTRAEAAVADATAAWAEDAEEAEWSLSQVRFAALDAEADVAFAERDLALARQALREANDAWSGPDGAGPGDAERERSDAALARAAIVLERERDAFYRTWNRYLLAAERYWSAAGVLGGVLAPPP